MGCSRISDRDNEMFSSVDDNMLQPIQLGAYTGVFCETRSGTGSVGSVNSGDNANTWNGEDIYVYAINQSEDLDSENKRVEINNERASTKNIVGSRGLLELQGGESHFYDKKGIYEFFAYHIDDAGVVPEYTYGQSLKVNVTIDGTQDLMVATTDKLSDINNVLNHLNTSPLPKGLELKVEDIQKLYTAWSARRNVVPILNFKHLLTRLKFYVKAGDELSCNAGLKIKSIEILNAKNKGVVTIIPVAEEKQGFVADAKQSNDKVFSLKQRPANKAGEELVDLKETDIDTTEKVAVGESLLVIPDERYTLRVVISQERNGRREDLTGEYEITTSNDENQLIPFEAGSSYDINLTIYKSKPIEIEASLGVWKEGGNSDIDLDDGFTSGDFSLANPLSITYKTTRANQTIKLASDLETHPIAGAENPLVGIDYGDGKMGLSEAHTFKNSGEHIVTFYFADEVKRIGDFAFHGCNNLFSIQYPKTVGEIGTDAFHNTGLVDITIPKTVSHVKSGAFFHCYQVERINIPHNENLQIDNMLNQTSGVLFLDSDLSPKSFNPFMSSCISKLVIGKNVTNISKCAFADCKKLASVSYEESFHLTSIKSLAFVNCSSLKKFEVPRSVTHIGDSVWVNCSSLERIESHSVNYPDHDGVLYAGNYETLLVYPAARVETLYEFFCFASKSIAPGAFWGAKTLKRIRLYYSTGIDKIGESAFRDCSNLIEILGLSDSKIDKIAAGTFAGCTSLSSLVIPKEVKIIGEEAFAKCSSMTGKLIIPATITKIGRHAFMGCSGFTGTLVIPSSIERIEEGTFAGCTGILEGSADLWLGENLKYIGAQAFNVSVHESGIDGKYSSFENIYIQSQRPPIVDSSSHLGGKRAIVLLKYKDNYADWHLPRGVPSVEFISSW